MVGGPPGVRFDGVVWLHWWVGGWGIVVWVVGGGPNSKHCWRTQRSARIVLQWFPCVACGLKSKQHFYSRGIVFPVTYGRSLCKPVGRNTISGSAIWYMEDAEGPLDRSKNNGLRRFRWAKTLKTQKKSCKIQRWNNLGHSEKMIFNKHFQGANSKLNSIYFPRKTPWNQKNGRI